MSIRQVCMTVISVVFLTTMTLSSCVLDDMKTSPHSGFEHMAD